MPKLYESPIATKFGYNIDKKNDEVGFDDEKHVYFDLNTGATFISVTQLISNYTNEFQEDFWVAYKSLEAMMDEDTFKVLKKTLLATKKFNPRILKKFNIDESEFNNKCEELRAEYKRKRDESTDRGTKIHAIFENSFYNKSKFEFGKFGFADLDGEYVCNRDYYKLDLENGVYPEFLISKTSRDGLLRLSGQIDCLIKRGNSFTIIDWKTNKEIKKQSYYNRSTRSYEMMKYPLNHLQDSTYNHYQLQLSCYAYLIEQLNPEYKINALKIIHVDHSGEQHELDCSYLRDEVILMLKHFKKNLKIKSELDALKPVIV